MAMSRLLWIAFRGLSFVPKGPQSTVRYYGFSA